MYVRMPYSIDSNGIHTANPAGIRQFQAQRTILPLPEGEGRGEGEGNNLEQKQSGFAYIHLLTPHPGLLPKEKGSPSPALAVVNNRFVAL